jgi:hypothetical protein
MKRLKLDADLSPHVQIHSKWIKDLNVSIKATKFLEARIRAKLYDFGLENDFLI